ncbi:MAG: peptide deformylase [Marinifilaceae bacterium]|jgi:peptide deformylase|nr:peptide deformylase [Marinifilaceae bacterium]
MILPITIYGHPVLRKIAKDIDNEYPDLENFINNMWETMYYSDGVGLAAPQVGKSIRMFVIDYNPENEDEDIAETDSDSNSDIIDGNKPFKRCFINAQITERFGDEVIYPEGCLSIPGLNENVKRPDTITIEYYDENWVFHKETYTGFGARVIQHEYDHLEGKVYTDHIAPIRKRLIKGKLNSISKGKFKAKYRYILG